MLSLHFFLHDLLSCDIILTNCRQSEREGRETERERVRKQYKLR